MQPNNSDPNQPRPPYQQAPYPPNAQPPNYYGGPPPPPNGPYYGQPQPPARKKRGWLGVLIVLVVLVVIGGVLVATGILTGSVTITGGDSGTLSIKSATMAKGFQNDEAVNPTTAFQTTDNPIHCVAKLVNTDNGTRVKAVWTAVDTTGGKNVSLGEKEVVMASAKDNTAHFSLTLPQAWPTGKYKVEIYLNDKLDRTLDFTIQ